MFEKNMSKTNGEMFYKMMDNVFGSEWKDNLFDIWSNPKEMFDREWWNSIYKEK